MGYCTLADVQALNSLRQGYSTDTFPTAVQVQIFIDTIAAEINANLAALGVTPPASSDYLRLMNIYGAAAMAEAASGMNGTDEAADPRDYRTLKYNAMLAELRANPGMATAVTGATTPGNIARSNYTDGYQPERGTGDDQAEIIASGGNW